MAENQYGFPTEVLSLPSQGLLYPEDSPLRSGTIDVKYMTAKEEDILTSTNLIAQGKVIERLLESVIVTPNVKLDDLLVGDKNAVMIPYSGYRYRLVHLVDRFLSFKRRIKSKVFS